MTFRNEPLIDFTIPRVRDEFRSALGRLEETVKRSPLSATPIVGGERLSSSTTIDSRDPSSPAVVLGRVTLATVEQAREALRTVRAYQPTWEGTPTANRCQVLRNAAAEMRTRKIELAALIIRESGKPWAEADADVAEAIDFCEYYADEMARLDRPVLTMEVPGEDNTYFYQPRGVAVVIAPWNFPLAIACGMTVAALVTGNTTILKPAEQTSLIAHEFAEILLRAGIPPHAFAFLPGIGEEIGPELTGSPETDLICFTGSKAVGLSIIKDAAQVRPGQRSVKRVIAEMGGKNAVIVDEDADLDEAVKGVLQSAFGYAGQKCSACSRCIVVGSAYEPFMSRLVDATRDIIVGPASDSSTFLPPVIDDEARQRILGTIAEYEKVHTLAYKGTTPSDGYFVPPTIFRDVATTSPLWNEEIFGPVVACRKESSFDDALACANNSAYALTGGVFSRSPSHLEKARRHFKVGNLYLNRKITGALVCRQPFGGFKMSGVGSKAGGADYLLQFLEPRTVTENTMRRGFTPSSK